MPDLSNLQAHPFANLLPMQTEQQLEELGADIQENGLLEKIILFEDQIRDGRNRYQALKIVGAELVYDWHFTEFHGNESEALRLVASLNLKRRHLTTSQRAMVASTIANLQHGGPRGGLTGGVTTGDAARTMKISPFMVRAARGIRRTATPGIVRMVETGEVSIAAAELVAALPAARQAKLTTPALVNAAAAKLRKSKRTFATYTPRRVVDIVGDLGEELSARGIGAFARETEAGSLARIDSTLALLGELRAAIAAIHACSQAPADMLV